MANTQKPLAVGTEQLLSYSRHEAACTVCSGIFLMQALVLCFRASVSPAIQFWA